VDKKKVLLISGGETIPCTFSSLLREEGYCVVTASSGLRVLEELCQHSFDLFITDLAMNDRRGFTILGMIKILFHNTPAIVFTSNRSEIVKKLVPLLDTCILIEKPCNYETFISCVRSSLTRSEYGIKKLHERLKDAS
jgi:DNA-binding response OmpR family regulator